MGEEALQETEVFSPAVRSDIRLASPDIARIGARADRGIDARVLDVRRERHEYGCDRQIESQRRKQRERARLLGEVAPRCPGDIVRHAGVRDRNAFGSPR